jgi:cell division protein FtsN
MKKPDLNGKTKKENRLEKVVVFLLVVLIGLLSFSVGVISGKGLSDKEYALKSMDTKYSHALNSDGTEGTKDAVGEGDLSEEEIQQLANAAIQAAEKSGDKVDAKADTAKAGDEVVAEKAPAKKDTAKTFENKASKTVAAKTQPTPFGNVAVKGAEERVPSSISKAAGALEYTVQVAAYPNVQDAESTAATFVKKGYPAFPFKVNIKGTDWYRVSIGSFKTKKEAMQYQDDLKKQGVVKEAMVQKLTK